MARGGSCGYFNKQPQSNKPTNNGVYERMPDANHAACAGLIFMCNESTKMDCFKYGVFGLSEKKRNLMDRITKGMHLFLFDVSLKLLYGIYAASSSGAFMLEPSAFGGNYPWQVKFQIEKYCLPLRENIFKEAIKDNYFTTFKFKIELNAEQVQKLVSLFSPLLGPLQHPGPNASNYNATPYINEASTVETDGHIQDEHIKGYILPGQTYANETVQSIQSDCLPKLNPPHNAMMSKNCMHGCHVSHSRHIFLPPALTCEASKPDGLTWSALPGLNLEPQDPLNQVVAAQKCEYNCHFPIAKHEHKCAAADPNQICRIERDAHMRSSPINKHNPAGPLSGPLSALCATTELQNIECNHIRIGAKLDLGNSTSHMHLPLVRQWHLISHEVHENSLERRMLSGGELMSGSSTIYSHSEIAAKAPILSSSLGHDCTTNTLKLPLQDFYTYAVGDIPMNGERPLKCTCHEGHSWPTDDVFSNVVDIVPSCVHTASYLSRGSASLSHSN